MNLMADRTTDRTELSDLVRDRRAELGLSLRGLADRCVDPKGREAGPLWKFGALGRLEKRQPVIPPQLPELRALAVGLDLPLEQVKEAAGSQFFGIDTVWSEDVRAMVRDYEAMTSDDRERLRLAMAAWKRERPAEPDTE
ncbi:XRE family transcriptional regulator [Streptomyces niveus]|uniref:XRE family transcriptional regulator n=1 Tax=Streptomyces niveus TaxID=193462 RepID=UPI0036D7FBFF